MGKRSCWIWVSEPVSLAVAVALLTACNALTDVSRIREPLAQAARECAEFSLGAALDCEPPCDDEAIICDDPPPDDYEEFYTDYVAAENIAPIELQGVYESGPITCIPGFTQGMTILPIPLPRQEGGFPLIKSIAFSGAWAIKAYLVGSAGTRADYWFPPGYFPATDGSGVSARVGYGRAMCSCTGIAVSRGILRILPSQCTVAESASREQYRRWAIGAGAGGMLVGVEYPRDQLLGRHRVARALGGLRALV